MEVITLLFVLSSIIIILTPGQDMMMVMSQSISHGKKAGIITALPDFITFEKEHKTISNKPHG